MQLITCDNGVLRQVTASSVSPADGFALAAVHPELAAWDQLSPGGVFAKRAVHELLFDDAAPRFAGAVLALAASTGESAGQVVWCDVDRTLYPPALGAMGFPLDQLLILQPPLEQLIWTIAECLRCKGVSAVVAELPGQLSRLEARKLQLAAERGGGVGIFLRSRKASRMWKASRDAIKPRHTAKAFGPIACAFAGENVFSDLRSVVQGRWLTDPGSSRRASLRKESRGLDCYAAATRWLVSPVPGERTVQRWAVRLLHGHGGQVGQAILLEKRRVSDYDFIIGERAIAVGAVPAAAAADSVRAPGALADHAGTAVRAAQSG